MTKKQKILAVIPARGGSKRIPRKNIRLLKGKPLISYAITAAFESGLVDKIVVSTEDKEIAQVAHQFGAEVPFIRPVELANHATSSFDVFRHALETIEAIDKTVYNIALLIQPTTPLVLAEDIVTVIQKLLKTKANSCVSVCEISERPEWMYKIKGHWALPFSNLHNIDTRSQDLPRVYRLNGAIYASKRHIILKKNRLLDRNSLTSIIMPRERSIDIDELIDFELAELLLKRCSND